MRMVFALSAFALLSACDSAAESDEEVATEVAPAIEELPAYEPKTRDEIRLELGIPTEAEFTAAATSNTFNGYIDWQLEWRGESRSNLAEMPGSRDLCAAMSTAGLDNCGYSTRVLLVWYLAANGASLFPSDYLSSYSGKAAENAVLTRSLRKNAALFENGDLTPEAAKRWQM